MAEKRCVGVHIYMYSTYNYMLFVQDGADDTTMIRKHFVGRITELNNQVSVQM